MVSTHQRVSLLLFTNLITIAELFSYASSSPRQANVEIARFVAVRCSVEASPTLPCGPVAHAYQETSLG